MNTSELNALLVTLVEKRMELGRLDYADKSYDIIEEELHHLEDVFVEQFGKEIEAVLAGLHKKYCPETEVLSPIAYLAKNYIKTGKYDNGTAIYDLADGKQGLIVDSREYEDVHLVILPNPVRILLTAQDGKVKEEVWKL